MLPLRETVARATRDYFAPCRHWWFWALAAVIAAAAVLIAPG